MISGIMPLWRQRYHLIATWVMCLLFGGIAVFVTISNFGKGEPENARLTFTVIFVAFAIIVAFLQFRFRRSHRDGRRLILDRYPDRLTYMTGSLLLPLIVVTM